MAQFKTPSGAIVDSETGQLVQIPTYEPGAMSPADLTSTETPTQGNQAEETPPPSVPEIETTKIEPTSKETDISSAIEEIRASNIALAEKEAFRAEEEEKAGMSKLLEAEQDFSSQLKVVQAEAKTIEDRMQQESEGRGRTTGGLAPLTAGELRKNSIRANTIGALLAASQGKVAFAQSQIDRVVQAKYGPEEAKNKALMANLELMLKDPTLTVEQTERANALLEKKKKEEDARKKKEEDTKTIIGLATKALENGAPASEAQQIANFGLQDKPDVSKAFEIYSKYQPKGTDITATAGSVEEFKLLNGRMPTSVQELNEFTASRSATGRKGEPSPTTGKVSGVTQSIIDNPSLFDDLTPTLKGVVIGELQANGYDTSNLGVKGLSDTAIKEVAQSQKALADLNELKTLIQGNENLLGPITGLQRFNPYSKARKLQADVDRVRQTVGKALEGGVLRKEDEDKYKKILATLADVPATAVYKIDALLSSIQRDIENYKSLQQASGKSLDIKAGLTKKGKKLTPEEARKKYEY